MRVSSVSASASAFIQASINTAPESASVTIAGISPSASNFGWKARPFSTSPGVPRAAKGGARSAGMAASPKHGVGAGTPLPARPMHHLQEAVAVAGVRLQRTGEAGGDGLHTGLAHAAHGHALVLGLDQHGHAAGGERRLDGIG